MAKLSITLDTETNNISVSVDGVAVDNVSYVSLSNYASYYYEDEGKPNYHFSVETAEKVGDVCKRTTLCASKKEGTVASTKYEGLFEKENAVASEVSFDIKKFLPTLTK